MIVNTSGMSFRQCAHWVSRATSADIDALDSALDIIEFPEVYSSYRLFQKESRLVSLRCEVSGVGTSDSTITLEDSVGSPSAAWACEMICDQQEVKDWLAD